MILQRRGETAGERREWRQLDWKQAGKREPLARTVPYCTHGPTVNLPPSSTVRTGIARRWTMRWTLSPGAKHLRLCLYQRCSGWRVHVVRSKRLPSCQRRAGEKRPLDETDALPKATWQAWKSSEAALGHRKADVQHDAGTLRATRTQLGSATGARALAGIRRIYRFIARRYPTPENDAEVPTLVGLHATCDRSARSRTWAVVLLLQCRGVDDPG